mgnify:CR=1 FL=1
MIGMWESSDPNFLYDGFRSFLSIFDGIATTLLGGIYKVFFLVANATIVSGDVIKVFYSRIQLILGILMIFKLAMSILNIIINPDIIKDQKQGPGKIVMRIVVALFMLTLVIPLNIPNATDKSLNAYINDHGILFGFLYKAQDAILSENILAKLILGTASDGDDMDVNNLSDVGNAMASTVLKVFIRINVYDDTEPPCENSETCENTICPGEVNESHYAEENVDPQVILSHLNDACGGLKRLSSKAERYAFAYTPVLGALVMLIMAFIIAGFTVDIAVRAIKLAILRLVAPVPIISYINPPKQGGGAFDNWLKALISTYVDLFVRIAIVYFGLFLIQIVMNGGLDIFGSNVDGLSFTSGIAFIFVILGILVFIRQAPQFIRDILGIKGKPMGNVGLSSLLGGTAMAIGGGGLAGFGLGAMQGVSAANKATAEGKAFSPFQSWAQNRDQMAKIRTGDKDARGGILGGMMDRSLYYARERQLGIKGLSYENAELAKNAHYAQQDRIHNAQLKRDFAYERLKQAGITEAPSVKYQQASEDLNNYVSYAQSQGWNQSTIEASDTYKQLSRNVNNARLWEDFEEADTILSQEQTLGGKIEKNYKNVSQARSTAGVDPRMIDEYGGSGIGGRRRGTYRAGGKRTRYDSYAQGDPSNLDDIEWRGPSIGGSPGGGHGPGGGGPRP